MSHVVQTNVFADLLAARVLSERAVAEIENIVYANVPYTLELSRKGDIVVASFVSNQDFIPSDDYRLNRDTPIDRREFDRNVHLGKKVLEAVSEGEARYQGIVMDGIKPIFGCEGVYMTYDKRTHYLLDIIAAKPRAEPLLQLVRTL